MTASQVLRLLLPLLRPYRRQIALALLLGCATVAANVGLLAVAAYVVAAAALKPLLITLSVPMDMVRVLGVGRALLRYGERLTTHRVTLSLLAELRSRIFARLEPLAPSILLNYRSGDLLARTVSDVDELQNLYLRILAPAVIALLIGGLTIGVFALFSLPLAGAAALFLLLAGVGIPLWGSRMARGLGNRQVGYRAELHNQMVDTLQGMPDLLACGRAQAQVEQIGAIDERRGAVDRRMAAVAGMQVCLSDLVTNLAVWAILILAIPLAAHGRIGGTYLAALALLMLGSFELAAPLSQAFPHLGRVKAASSRLFALTAAQPEVTDPPEPLPVPASPALSFERVSFSYQAAAERALVDVNFCLEPGTWVGVVGPSGAGKSTLINLALRFWDPTAGSVRLAGRDIRQYGLDDLRAQFALVGQDTTLFADTLRNNLLLAGPGASDIDLLCAVKQAQLGDLLASLPKGIDTWIGEQGLRLSGGERQRLAIARALLRDAPVLLLDEPTANLDPITEGSVLDTLFELMRSRTVLMISHRLTTLQRMDEILVLDAGRLVQRGSYQELSCRDGLFRDLLALDQESLAFN